MMELMLSREDQRIYLRRECRWATLVPYPQHSKDDESVRMRCEVGLKILGFLIPHPLPLSFFSYLFHPPFLSWFLRLSHLYSVENNGAKDE